jgi:hypothetical protein
VHVVGVDDDRIRAPGDLHGDFIDGRTNRRIRGGHVRL